ncbi:MAG TPA: FkbM family methyltransferase [Lysobacter sp.]|nr:FkbM family methyltransferase [Lysobacter sp.]
MKEIIKTIIPNAWTPMVRELYRRVADRTPRIRHSYGDTEKLAALKCAVSYNKYGGYCIPESAFHRPAAKAVLSGKVYEPRTIEYMVANCRNRDIIHAGTFFGDFLPALSGAINPNALVWAFEPNLENFRCAKITLELNEASNVRLTHAGLGAKTERLFVQTADASGRSLGGTSHIVDKTCGAGKKESVDIVTIDDAIPSERDIGILQLDVEGYEKEVLLGALSTIRRCLPLLILEVLPNSTLVQSDWFLKNIVSLGYENVAKLHGNSVYSCKSIQTCS